MSFKCGIVGLPNVGKSTLFNALTNSNKAQAANFPFCTIDPNVGIVAVPDNRVENLAKISKSKSKSYTQVSWIVDFERFGIKEYGDDMMKLMMRRIYDVCGTSPSDVKFYYNRKSIKIDTFEKYIDLYLKILLMAVKSQ